MKSKRRYEERTEKKQTNGDAKASGQVDKSHPRDLFVTDRRDVVKAPPATVENNGIGNDQGDILNRAR